LYAIKKDFKKAFELIKIAVELEDLQAIHLIGNFYYRGIGCEKNEKLAFKYFLISSETNPSSLKQIALFYENGIGVEKNYLKSIESYLKYYQYNSDESLLIKIGELYYHMKDFKNSFNYFYKSAENDNPLGLAYVGTFYYEGFGVERNIEIAIKYLEKSKKKNNFDAIYLLYNIYLNEGNQEKSCENLKLIFDYVSDKEKSLYNNYCLFK